MGEWKGTGGEGRKNEWEKMVKRDERGMYKGGGVTIRFFFNSIIYIK